MQVEPMVPVHPMPKLDTQHLQIAVTVVHPVALVVPASLSCLLLHSNLYFKQ
jgi:hypothetical protein